MIEGSWRRNLAITGAVTAALAAAMLFALYGAQPTQKFDDPAYADIAEKLSDDVADGGDF